MVDQVTMHRALVGFRQSDNLRVVATRADKQQARAPRARNGILRVAVDGLPDYVAHSGAIINCAS